VRGEFLQFCATLKQQRGPRAGKRSDEDRPFHLARGKMFSKQAILKIRK